MATTAIEVPDDMRDALDAAIVKINSMFVNAYDWTGKQSSPTGEYFRDMMEGPYDHYLMAIEQMIVWFSFCSKYSPGASIYWQVNPEIEHFRGKNSGFRIYCRYLISDKPKRD